MKILFISPHPGFGGASTANQNIARSIALAGHEVVYVDEYLPKQIADKSLLNVEFYPVHKNKFLGQFKTLKYIYSHKPDFIILGMPIIGVFTCLAMLMLRIKGVKIGCVFHSLSLSKNFSGMISEILVATFSLMCTHLFFVSQYTLLSWRKYWPVKWNKKAWNVIYNTVEKYEGEANLPATEKIYVGFVGRFSDEKQPKVFCEVAKAYKDSNVKFIAYGDGPLLVECEETYSDCVEFMGYCNDLDKIYSKINILLMTSKFENCPMVILESALRGIPAVVPCVGGIPEVINSGKNGELYTEYATQQIKNCIDKILNNYRLYSTETKNLAQSYTLESKSMEWDRVLKS